MLSKLVISTHLPPINFNELRNNNLGVGIRIIRIQESAE
jgi:hypothetical protein